MLPTLTLKNEKDEDLEVSTLAKEKGVILFLVPKADTREFFQYLAGILWFLHYYGLNSWLYDASLRLPRRLPRLYVLRVRRLLLERRLAFCPEQVADKGTQEYLVFNSQSHPCE